MEINIDCCLNCPTGLHGPTQRAIHNTKLEESLSLLHLPSGKNLTPKTSINQQINLNDHSSPAQLKKLPQSVSTPSNPFSNEVIHPHKKSKLLKQVKRFFSFNHSHLHKEVSNLSSSAAAAKVNSEASAAEHVNDVTVSEPIHCCELDRRSESLINHYREVFNYSPEGDSEMLEQRKRLVAVLTPCTFVRSSDQWKQIKDILQEVINGEAPYATNNSDEFVPVGDLFISAHRFMEVQFNSETQIFPDPKSSIALPFPAKCVNLLTPATESEICADVDLRDLIGLSSIWFVYVDSDLLADTDIKSANEYDRYAKQLLTDLFTKGSFGLIGDQHKLIVPLIFDLDSKTLNTSRIPSNLRPFCGVITKDGLYLGQVVLELVSKLFSFLLNELFINTSIKNFYNTRSEITIISEKITSQIENLRIAIFLYYMDLRILSVQTKFACLENIKVKKREKETDSSVIQYLLNLIEFGNNIIEVNSNLLLQGILQNRYQFKIEEYWIYSIGKEQNDQLKQITNALESTFGKIQMIISNFKKLDITFSAEKLSQMILKLCLSFLHIFFQDCDFSLNEEITVVHFNSDTKQYIKNTEKITLNCLKDMLLYNPRQTKQLPISFVDFFLLMHLVLEQFTPKKILQEWIPVLHCELQLIFNKLLWLDDSHNSNYPDFYFTFPIPLGKERSDLSWRHLLKALNVIATCCERMNLPNNDLLFITVCEIIYQIFLPHYNFSTKSANKNLDPKWRLIEFRASRTSTQELTFRSEFTSIDWKPVGNVFQLLLMHFWSKPPDILQVQVLTSFLNNLFKKSSANLSDNDAGILRFSGMIESHAAIRERGSNISLVNDARFDSLHFLIPRILFRPKQLVDNFEDLQKQAWDENPFRFLIQYQVEKSEPDGAQDARELEPPWQYSTVTLPLKLLILQDPSLVHSTEDLQEHKTTPSAATQQKQVVFNDSLQERSNGVPVKTVNVRSTRMRRESHNLAFADGFDALDLPRTRARTSTATAFPTLTQNTSRSRRYSHITRDPSKTSPAQMSEKQGTSSPLVDEQHSCSDEQEISSQSPSQHTETSTAGSSSNATSHITTDLQLEIVVGLSTAVSEDASSEATKPMQTTRADDTAALDQYSKFMVVVENGRRRVILPADNVFRGFEPESEQNPGPEADNTIEVGRLEAATGKGSTTTLHLQCHEEKLDTEKADSEDPLFMNASCVMNTH